MAPLYNVKSNDLEITEKYVPKCLEYYDLEDIINNFKTLESFVSNIIKGKDTHNEKINLYKNLSKKIYKICMEVDSSKHSTTLVQSCGLLTYRLTITTLTTGSTS